MKGKFSTQQIVVLVVTAIAVLTIAVVAQEGINEAVSFAMQASTN
jgi:hypothetical protein